MTRMTHIFADAGKDLGATLGRFFRGRRAAATALGAAMMTLMSVGGIALTSDHTHLVYQRDVLKAGVDAATLATTRHMLRLDTSLSKAQIIEALKPIARRYILANIPADRRTHASDTLAMTLSPNRTAGTVDITATADLGGTIVGKWLYGQVVPEMRAGSLTERVEEGGALEVALAIDTTASMDLDFNGQQIGTRKLATVKQAARDLIDVLTAEGGQVAVGLVPWGVHVRFDQTTRTHWEDERWAVYPTSRYYPRPFKGSGGETQTLPAKPEAWHGCLTQRSMSGANPPGVSAALPAASTFTMNFYTPKMLRGRNWWIAYQCTTNREQHFCYSRPDRHRTRDINGVRQRSMRPQDSSYIQGGQCREQNSTLRPLTTDTDSIRNAINGLAADAGATYSTPGIAWAHRLLASDWRTIWGDATHPMDAGDRVHKAIVLFTDGVDNYFGYFGDGPAKVKEHRRKACTAAKNAGIKMFAIAAVEHSEISNVEPELTRCSSQADDPDGTYVFVNNVTPEALRGSFQQVARQLARFRRIN